MQHYSTNIDITKLLKLLESTFEKLPKDYFKAYKDFSKSCSKSYFRQSLISEWIAIPVTKNVVFKNFHETYRIKNIFIPTINKTKIELQIYLHRNGIIGINVGDDLENLMFDKIDTSQFIIEKVPTSKYLTKQTDLEYLDDFDEIDEYLDDKYASEEFTINNVKYYSIITLSDKNCIAIDDKRSVYLLDKVSGLTKFISKQPDEFLRAFKDKTLNWLDEL